MLKKAYLLFSILVTVHMCGAQTTFLPVGSDDYLLLDRLETRSGRLCDSLALGDKPESRRNAVHFVETIQANDTANAASAPQTVSSLSKIDRYNMGQLISENGEWTPNENGEIDSKHSWFNTFYKKQYDFVYVKAKDFFMVINPVLSGIALEQHNDPAPGSSISNRVLTNSHGAEMRLWISKKISFYTLFTDNQEQYPYFVYNSVTSNHQNVPGADYFLRPGTSKGYYDYMQASGYVNFDAVKDHLNITFGSGKHFIGDGISSLFLTDYSSNMPFLQVQARIWHFNYEALYLELTPQYDKNQGDALLQHKYSTMHYLTWNATRWLNLGFFESEVFDRPNSYEISYLNPIIVSTAINRFNGEGDKSILGFSGKAIVAKHLQFYGQFMLNEFRYSEFFGNKGWYGNKWGVQAGAKYFDAFTVKNLDLQLELDAVRPYTYTAKDSLANYTNYNQPLADPLGAGFVKTIGLIRYQPVKNLTLTAMATYYVQGVDTGSANFGNNIFTPYLTAAHDYGVNMINGPKSHCEILSLNVSYQVRRNLFLDAGGTYRKYANNSGIYNNDYSTTGPSYGALTTSYVYFGIRLNAVRRDYNWF
jgi:hypothetical protein